MGKRYAIVTKCYYKDEVSNTNIKAMSKISHILIQNYAKKCNAEFIIINKKKINLGTFHNEIFQCYEILDKYDRIAYIDTDVIINPITPNIFNTVPESMIGLIFEDIGPDKWNRRDDIKQVQKEFGNVGWEKGYLNNGFFVVSKIHKDIFKIDPDKFWNKLGYDDVQMGYNIHKYGFEVFQLPYKYNHISLFSMFGKNWLKSFILHYAGRGFYRRMPKEEQMKRDLEILNNYSSFQINFINIIPRLRLIMIGLMETIQAIFRKGFTK